MSKALGLVAMYNTGKYIKDNFSVKKTKKAIKKTLGGRKVNMTTGQKISAGLKKYWKNKKRAVKNSFK
mgnify:FL=1